LANLNGEKKKLKKRFESAAKAAFVFSQDISFYVMRRIQTMKSLEQKAHRSLGKIREMVFAPYEADQELAFLNTKLRNLHREVAVMSQDGDLLAYKNIHTVCPEYVLNIFI
jgi:hypothetical protein